MAYASVLKQADIFFDLAAAELERVAALCQERRYGLGDLIFEENSASHELYLIAQGEVDIQVDPALVADANARPSRPITLTTLRRGQVFGEIALVDQGLRSATARSVAKDTLVLVIPRDKLMALCESDPNLGFRIMRNLASDVALKLRTTGYLIREEVLYGAPRRERK